MRENERGKKERVLINSSVCDGVDDLSLTVELMKREIRLKKKVEKATIIYVRRD